MVREKTAGMLELSLVSMVRMATSSYFRQYPSMFVQKEERSCLELTHQGASMRRLQ